MEALAAFGVAVNVIQVIDFSMKLVSESRDIYNSADDQLTEHSELALTTKTMAALIDRLERSLECDSARATSTKNLPQRRLGHGCRAVAVELLQALSQLKVEGTNKRWKSCRQALLTIWHKDKIDALEKRLSRFRDQIVAVVLVSLRDQVDVQSQKQTSVLGHVSIIEENTQNIKHAFQEHIEESKKWHEHLLQAIHQSTQQIPPSRELLGCVSGQIIAERAKELQQRLLSHLHYPTITDRHDRVTTAHRKTFEWIFQEPKTVRPWSSFVNWMATGDNLYWITGKAGSGKSTLMKFLYNDPRTSEHLQSSALPLPLVTSAFFFWNSGNEMQMSQLGLLQTLLYEALYKCQFLIPRLFPKRWKAYSYFGDDTSPWAWSELVTALKLLVKEDGTTIKLCLFIDGLDEFNGNHDHLIDLIQDLVSSSTAKICVSSRPWLVFEEAFRVVPHLMLQYLTYSDIQLYIRNKFQSNAHFVNLGNAEPEFAGNLLRQIAKKAQGVFLWVYLVVQSLLTGLRNGDRIEDLQRRLDALPPDLENLFSKILLNLDPFYREHASQIFQVYRAANEDISLLRLSFADEEDTEHVFRADVRPLSQSEKQRRFDKMKRRLNSRCMGLLEVTPIEADQFASAAEKAAWVHWKVQYLHRTVKDFFAKPGIWKDLRRFTKASFSPYSSLFRASILHFKTLGATDLTLNNFWSCVTNCLDYAVLAKETPRMQVRLLDEVDRTACKLAVRPGSEMCQVLKDQININPSNCHWTTIRFSFASNYSFLHLMVLYDQREYLRAKLGKMSPDDHDVNLGHLLNTAVSDFGGCTLPQNKPINSQRAPRLRTIRVLFEAGVDPTSVEVTGRANPWLRACSIGILEAPNERFRQAWQEVADLFISHGADPGADVHGIVSPAPPKSHVCNLPSSRLHYEDEEVKLLSRLGSRGRVVGLHDCKSHGSHLIAMKQFKREDDEASVTSIQANNSDSRISQDSMSTSEFSDSSEEERQHPRWALGNMLPTFVPQKAALKHLSVQPDKIKQQSRMVKHKPPASMEPVLPKPYMNPEVVPNETETIKVSAAERPRGSFNASEADETSRVRVEKVSQADPVKSTLITREMKVGPRALRRVQGDIGSRTPRVQHQLH